MGNSKFTDISDKKFLTSTMNFYNNCKSPDVKKMDDLDDLVNSLVADAEAGADGSLRKSDLKDGLQHLLVTPRWRKNTPNNTPKADTTSNIAVLSRLSTGQQEYILREITNLYIPDSADQDKLIELPTDYSNLDQLIDNGVKNYVVKKQAAIAEVEKQKASLQTQKSKLERDQRNTQFAIGMCKSSGVSESDIKLREQALADINSNIAKLEIEINKLNNKKNALEEDKKSNQTKVSTIKKYLQGQIIEDLQPINAETMAEGYVYIFLQDSNVEGHAELSLYKEYKSSITNNNTFYAEVDISEYKNCDYRVADADSAKTHITLPACYAKDQATYELQKVVVLFSTVQLSSARLAKIESDSKLQTQHAKTLNSSNLKDSFDMSLVENISYAEAKARDIKYNYQDNGATQTQWTELEVYPIYNYNRKTIGWNLLLDNPLGVMNNNNFAIDWLQTQLSNICVQIQANNYGKSSILIANFLFNPQASGLLDVDFGGMDTDSLLNKTFVNPYFSDDNVKKTYKEKLTTWKAKKDKLDEVDRTKGTIDLDRLKYNLRSKVRELMRNLMEAFQKQGLEWVDPKDSLIECWRDIFSQGAHGYSSSFEKWFDTVNHLSLDPKDTDSLYDVISNRPVDKLKVQVDIPKPTIYDAMSTTDSDFTRQDATLTGYTLTTYEYHIYYYKKTVKTYDEKLNLKGDPEVSYVQKDDPKTVIADIGAYAKGKAPDGLKYITRALKPNDCASDDIIRTWIANSVTQITGENLNTFLEGGKPKVSELLIPTDDIPADKSQGLYDAKKLALSNSIELILSQAKDTPVPRNQFNEAVMKYSEEYM
ncbi:hypothetical protein, partial [Francisella sp. SYW-2]|uniref:hypothetical protein n=1 Tax=Francisella sp. SYW-2 TaxID=2610886 RepID=UPI00123CBFE0